MRTSQASWQSSGGQKKARPPDAGRFDADSVAQAPPSVSAGSLAGPLVIRTMCIAPNGLLGGGLPPEMFWEQRRPYVR